MDSRVDEIDVAKGIGILLVILGHIIPENTYIRTVIYSFHMSLFFFLSGLLAKKQYSFNQKKTERKKRRFIKSNSRLIACYLFYSFVFIMFDIIFKGLLKRDFEVAFLKKDIIDTVTLFGINVLWFITAIIIAKNLGYVIIKQINKKRIQLLISILLFLLASCLGFAIAIPSHAVGKIIVNIIIAVFRGVLGCSFWLLGYCLKEIIVSLFRRLDVVRCLLIATLLMVVLMSLSYLNYNRGQIIDIHYLKIHFGSMLYLTSIVGTVAILILSRALVLCKRSSFAIFFGKNSLIVMITHEYLGGRKLARLLMGLSNYSVICNNLVIAYVVEFVLVCIIELLLCYVLAPIDAKIIRGIQTFLNRL